MSREKLLNTVSLALRGKAVFALAFGSILRRGFDAESDIDIGVYWKPKFENSEIQFELASKLGNKLNRKVDFVALNRTDIIITMQILANGRLLIDSDHSFFVLYKARKMSEYIDFKMSRKIIEDSLLKEGTHRARR